MSAPTRLILVRHGRTAWNVEGRFQGHADPPLDDTGWGQAAAVATALRPTPVAAVLSSDLTRARQTAALIALGRGLRVTLSSELRETNLGCWTGLSRAEAAQRFPDEYRAWHNDPHSTRRGGGETEAEAGARVARHIGAVARAWPGQAIVVVCHGLALRAAVALLRDPRAPDASPHLGNGEWITIAWPGHMS